MSLRPNYYTEYEGGPWLPFNQSFTEHDIPALSKRHPTSVPIAHLRVHALAFGNPTAGEGYYLRWDCLNGFTQRSPYQQEKAE